MYNTIQTKDYKEFQLDNGVTLTLQDIDRVLPGDIVERSSIKSVWQTAQRAEHPLLVGLLDVKSKYVYGMSSRGTPQYLFTPYNESYPPFIVGCAAKDRTHNKIVLIRFDSWEKGQKFPKGALVETFGNAGDFKTEAKALYLQYSPWTFKKDIIIPPVQRSLDVIKEEDEEQDEDDTNLSSSEAPSERLDLTTKYTFNIDPPGCKDIDDVLTIYTKDDNTIYLVITIADVAEMVDENGALDQHAVKTGQSLYSHFLPPRNMLPAKLSEDELSLIPGKPRLGVSLFCKFSQNTLISSDFHLTIIENKKSFSYDSFKIDAPQAIVETVKNTSAVISGSPSDDPHKWIETFMIHYNSQVAKILSTHKVGIFRGQKPSQADLKDRYAQICPELAHEAAIYTTAIDILPHTALGLTKYCYASSPIRRYVDIVNQRYLKAILMRDWYDIALTSHMDIYEVVNQQNTLQKGAKRQSRDDFLLSEISKNSEKILEGIIFDADAERIKVYVPAWKRIVKVRSWFGDYTPRDPVKLKYFYNPDQISWKNRIVFQIQDNPNSNSNM